MTGTSRYLLISVVAAVALCGGLMAVVLGGCSGGSDDNTGTLSVAMTDQAETDYASVVVSIQAVYAVPAGDGDDATPGLPLVVEFSPSLVVDVLTLNFIQQVLGTALVPAGEYEQIRLVLDPNPSVGDPVNYVTLASDPGTKIPLQTPSGQQSGLKIVGRYTVQAGEFTAIALDFDPAKAIVLTGGGNYILKPTGIRIVQIEDILTTYGSLSGVVAPDLAWPTAIVSVVPEGASLAIASGTVDLDDGSFRAFLPPGSYAVRVSATGYLPYDSATIPLFHAVVLGADTAVGTITLTPTP
jgi:hypothetical protein